MYTVPSLSYTCICIYPLSLSLFLSFSLYLPPLSSLPHTHTLSRALSLPLGEPGAQQCRWRPCDELVEEALKAILDPIKGGDNKPYLSPDPGAHVALLINSIGVCVCVCVPARVSVSIPRDFCVCVCDREKEREREYLLELVHTYKKTIVCLFVIEQERERVCA